jgi:hypothetical protein
LTTRQLTSDKRSSNVRYAGSGGLGIRPVIEEKQEKQEELKNDDISLSIDGRRITININKKIIDNFDGFTVKIIP